MRYNSLRSQLNWHSRQQTHTFKNMQKHKLDPDILSLNLESQQPKQQVELVWLEKMVRELQMYKDSVEDKELATTFQRETVKARSIADILGEKCNHVDKNVPKKVVLKFQSTAGQASKSKKKIKPETVTDKQNKTPSAKRSTSIHLKGTEIKRKQPKKQPKTKKQAEFNRKPSSEHIKFIPKNDNCRTPVTQIHQLNTQPYIVKQSQPSIMESLWSKKGESDLLTNKKSVGRIVRNNERFSEEKKTNPLKDTMKGLKKDENNMEKMQMIQKGSSSELKKQRSPVSAKQFKGRDLKEVRIIQAAKQRMRPEKVLIKLEIEKLSEYGVSRDENENKEGNKSIISTEEYQKYCPEKEREQRTKDLEGDINISLIQLGKVRFKSEQRKLNTSVHKKRKRHDSSEKGKQSFQFSQSKQENQKPCFAVSYSPAINVPSILDHIEPKIEFKLKRGYEYTEEYTEQRILKDERFRIPKEQKLFTLNSKRSSQDHQEASLSHQDAFLIYSQQTSLMEQAPIVQEKPQCIANTRSQASAKIHVTSPYDVSQQLTLLFNFLDEGHRGLLTDTNCNFDSLTEELKLLFSCILNQIRTKKRFYNLPKFIDQSSQILPIKNQIYSGNGPKDAAYVILRQNLQILRKKHPLLSYNCIHTNSLYEPSACNSKRNSINSNQSFVLETVKFIDKYSLDNRHMHQPAKESSPKLISNIANITDQTINMEQPEIYLERKHSLAKSGAEQQRLSTIFLKTREYLKNLERNNPL